MAPRALAIAIAACLAGAAPADEPTDQPRSVSFDRDDGLPIVADLYPTDSDTQKGVILLFHQEGSNARAEFADLIAPRLVDMGYDVVAPDLGAGGPRYGQNNRTIDARANATTDPEGAEHVLTLSGQSAHDDCDAYPDMLATLLWARHAGFEGPIVLIGGGFSGSLAVRLAAERPDPDSGVARVIALSPLSPGCQPAEFIDGVGDRTLIVFAEPELADAGAKAASGLLQGAGARVVVEPCDAHGYSMLHPDRRGGGADAAWAIIAEALEAPAPPEQ